MFIKFSRLLHHKPLSFKFSQQTSTYTKNLTLFFNHLSQQASQTPWQPNNVIYEETNDKIPRAFQAATSENLKYFLPSISCAIGIHLFITPYITIIPMYYSMKYLSGFAILQVISKRIVRKFELIDKETMRIFVFFQEKPDIILLKSLDIHEISKTEDLTVKNYFFIEEFKDYYCVRFEGLAKDNKGRKNYFLLCKKKDEVSMERIQVMKTIFLEAEGMNN